MCRQPRVQHRMKVNRVRARSKEVATLSRDGEGVLAEVLEEGVLPLKPAGQESTNQTPGIHKDGVGNNNPYSLRPNGRKVKARICKNASNEIPTRGY